MTDINPNLFTLHCRTCGERLTKPVAALDEGHALVDSQGDSLIPAGHFAPSERVVGTCENFYGVQAKALLINTDDLDGARCIPTNMGCCGSDGSKPDLVCPKGHMVGTIVADCWQPHFSHFPLEWVSLAPAPKAAATVAI